MGLFTNPLGYAGYPPGATGEPTTVNSTVRAATAAEAAAGTLDDAYISPATAQSATALDFASPPALGYGSTTPRPVAATTLSAVGATTINTSGAAATTIGTGGTGAVNIGNATGNTSVSGNLNLAGGSIDLNSGSITVQVGGVAAGGSISGGGNFIKLFATSKDVYNSLATTTAAGSNAAGTVTLAGGTATISTTSVTADSKIRIYRQGIGATGAAALGILTIGTIVAATSFVINSVQAADATALQATDVSVVFWELVN